MVNSKVVVTCLYFSFSFLFLGILSFYSESLFGAVFYFSITQSSMFPWVESKLIPTLVMSDGVTVPLGRRIYPACDARILPFVA